MDCARRQPVRQVVDVVVGPMPEVDNQKQAVGERLKEARAALRLTQKELCAKVEMPLPSLRDYELGKRIPGGDAIAALIRAGINANWLLTGEGPMLLAELGAVPAGALDQKRLQEALQATDEGLSAAGRTMRPEKKAELVLAIYDLLQEPAVTKERVLKLVKLAA